MYSLLALQNENCQTHLFSRYPITHFAMVPTMTYQILHNPELAKLDLSGLVSAISGAAHLPPELRAAFGRRATKLPYLIQGKALLRRQLGSHLRQHRRIRTIRMCMAFLQHVCRSTTLSRCISDEFGYYAPPSRHAWGPR